MLPGSVPCSDSVMQSEVPGEELSGTAWGEDASLTACCKTDSQHCFYFPPFPPIKAKILFRTLLVGETGTFIKVKWWNVNFQKVEGTSTQ